MFADEETITLFVKTAKDRLLSRGVSPQAVQPYLSEILRKEAAYQGMLGAGELARASAIDSVMKRTGVDILKAAEIIDSQL